MAGIEVKRSVHKKQSALTKAARRNDRRAPNRHPDRGKPAERRTQTRSSSKKAYRRVFHFPQTRGKQVEDVEFSTSTDYHNISINFQDKTALNFSIETGFTLEPDYSDWKSGNQRVIRTWSPIRAQG